MLLNMEVDIAIFLYIMQHCLLMSSWVVDHHSTIHGNEPNMQMAKRHIRHLSDLTARRYASLFSVLPHQKL